MGKEWLFFTHDAYNAGKNRQLLPTLSATCNRNRGFVRMFRTHVNEIVIPCVCGLRGESVWN
jgi:hypothetical protein